MRFAFADPPYIGQAKRHYAHEPRCAEVDHEVLLRQLVGEFPDGWALSCSTPSLEAILHLARTVCGENRIRVGAWVKPFASFKPGVNPGYCWEPVVWLGGRKPSSGEVSELLRQLARMTRLARRAYNDRVAIEAMSTYTGPLCPSCQASFPETPDGRCASCAYQPEPV